MDLDAGDVVLCEFYFSNLRVFKKRPVLIFKDNLPFDDFIGLPLSSKIEKLQEDELIIQHHMLSDGVLPAVSKVMLRKPFIISKQMPQKKYGKIAIETFDLIHQGFCRYFGCCTKQ